MEEGNEVCFITCCGLLSGPLPIPPLAPYSQMEGDRLLVFDPITPLGVTAALLREGHTNSYDATIGQIQDRSRSHPALTFVDQHLVEVGRQGRDMVEFEQLISATRLM